MASEHRKPNVFQRHGLSPAKLYHIAGIPLAFFIAGSMVAVFAANWATLSDGYNSFPDWAFVAGSVTAAAGFTASVGLILAAIAAVYLR